MGNTTTSFRDWMCPSKPPIWDKNEDLLKCQLKTNLIEPDIQIDAHGVDVAAGGPSSLSESIANYPLSRGEVLFGQVNGHESGPVFGHAPLLPLLEHLFIVHSASSHPSMSSVLFVVCRIRVTSHNATATASHTQFIATFHESSNLLLLLCILLSYLLSSLFCLSNACSLLSVSLLASLSRSLTPDWLKLQNTAVAFLE